MSKEQKTMLEVIRVTNDYDNILQALASKDIENFNNEEKENTNHAKKFIELTAYYFYTQLNEQSEINLTVFKSAKSLKIIATYAPYILGIKGFSISFEKEIKEIKLTMNRPFGKYKEELEQEGLIFLERTKEEEEQLRAEQQDTVNEANSMLASVGLTQFIK